MTNSVRSTGNITTDAMDALDREEQEAKQLKNETSGFDVKNYLNVRLDKGQESKELIIRLLPIAKDSDSPLQIIHMHSLRLKPEQITPGGSEWKNYICLEKTNGLNPELGHKCPFCETNRDAYNRSTKCDNDAEKNMWQKISLSMLANKVGILRCIERGHEEDGPKFWKFNIRQDGKDPWSLIKKLYHDRMKESLEEGDDPENILDIYTGKDLKVTITDIKDKTGKSIGRTSIDIVDYRKNKPLSSDDEQIEKWLNDEKKWSDVFVAKDYDYLSIMLDGKKPFYDKTLGKWVCYEDKSTRKNEEEKATNQEIANAEKAANDLSYVDDDGCEDLPY